MNTFIKDIQQIMAIRKLRVDSSRRKQKLKALEQDQAARAIESAQAHFEQTEQRLIQIELETLQRLTNGNFVKVDQLACSSVKPNLSIMYARNFSFSVWVSSLGLSTLFVLRESVLVAASTIVCSPE